MPDDEPLLFPELAPGSRPPTSTEIKRLVAERLRDFHLYQAARAQRRAQALWRKKNPRPVPHQTSI